MATETRATLLEIASLSFSKCDQEKEITENTQEGAVSGRLAREDLIKMKRSPQVPNRGGSQRQSMESLNNSSQESLNTQSNNNMKESRGDPTIDGGLVRDDSRNSFISRLIDESIDECEEGGETTAADLCGYINVVAPKPGETSVDGCSSNDDKENHAQIGFLDSQAKHPTAMDNPTESSRLGDRKSVERLTDKNGLIGNSKDGTFEKSLEHIMDKCSDKSLEISNFETRSGANSDTGKPLDDHLKGGKKRKSASWYTMLSPNYKSRSEDFKRIFKDIPNDERLIVEYSCAIQKDILVQGRMFMSQNWICFYANIFRWETVLTIPCKDITAITKEKTARVIPNAIQVVTTKMDKYFFTSFGSRDKTFMMLFRIWQNALIDLPMNPKELWHWVHYSYGEELGLHSSDDDYITPLGVEEVKARLNKDDSYTDKDTSVINGHTSFDESNISISNTQSPELIFGSQRDQVLSSSVDGPDMPTDFGDTSEESEGEVMCTEHAHYERPLINGIFYIHVDKMFEFLFTDCDFYRQLAEAKKMYDLILPPWQDNPDSLIGHRVRECSYGLTLNAAFGPKTSPAIEKQVCYEESKVGMFYLIDAENITTGIPYGDSFSVWNRYCITRVSKNKCRLRVTNEIKYKKSVWGLIRNIIEKNVNHGLADHFQILEAHLRAESQKQEHLAGLQPSKKKLRKRRRQVALTEVQTARQLSRQNEVRLAAPSTPSKSPLQREENMVKLHAESLLRIVCIILLLLVMFNAVLFYKLSSLEKQTSYFSIPHERINFENVEKYPVSQEEWVRLLKQQQFLHDSEKDRWRDVLETSIVLIDQMKQTLIHMKQSIDTTAENDFTTTPHEKDPPPEKSTKT